MLKSTTLVPDHRSGWLTRQKSWKCVDYKSTSKKSSFRLSIVFEDPESTESEEDETDSFDQKSFDKSEFDQNKFNDTPDRALEGILIEEEQVKLWLG